MSEKKLEEIRAWFREGLSGRVMTARFTAKIDRILQSVFNAEFHEENLVLIATGGYGRGEMAPFSDVDIMFFAPDRKDTGTAERVLYKLWDTGLDISHSFRTAGECIEESLKDIRTRTSLLEARYIAGDKKLFRIFRNEVYPEIAYKRQKDFVGRKLMETGKRHLSSGDSVYLLEPHIKEGEGGLRDVHTAYWISRVALKIENTDDFERLLGPYDYRRFLSAYDFLLRARFSLHLESKRKNDILSFEYQKAVAETLGFRDSLKFTASERMLRYYYLKSRTIKDLTRRIMVKCSRPYLDLRRDMHIRKITDDFSVSGGRLIATKDHLFVNAPDKLLECFYLYSKTGKRFSDTLRDNIRASLLRITHRTRSSSAAVHYFLDILKSARVYDTLLEMHETGVLGRFIPEFGALRLLVVHEPYHMYTVDAHTLMALRNLEALRTTHYRNLEDLHIIVNRMERFDVLYMALLFHDIGKAAGRHHEEEGYKRLKNIMERFNLDIKKRTRIEFLVRNHVLMSRIALRREAGDTEVIAKFADAVGDPENLKAIYLITYADMSAVNPGFWTSWKAYLLRELYEHTLDYLSGIKEDRTEYIKSLRGLSSDRELRKIVDFVQEMPERYIVSTTRGRVLEDYRLVQRVKESGFSMRIDSSQAGVVEMSICALDCPGLFSRVVGFLSAKGLNIVNGRIFTGNNGIVIDKIAVSNWEDVWWDGIVNDLEEGLKGIIIDRKPVNIIRRCIKAESPFDVFIELDNEVSDEFSLIEIFSPDRLGLLYDISDVMYRKGVNIISARINTEAGLAQDLFYVQSDRRKINYTGAEELLSELWMVLKGQE
jgi:[protein-PII] uridylyltransferase